MGFPDESQEALRFQSGRIDALPAYRPILNPSFYAWRNSNIAPPRHDPAGPGQGASHAGDHTGRPEDPCWCTGASSRQELATGHLSKCTGPLQLLGRYVTNQHYQVIDESRLRFCGAAFSPSQKLGEHCSFMVRISP